MKPYLNRALAIAGLIMLGVLPPSFPEATAQSVSSVIDAGNRKIRLAQESQERIDKVVDQTRSLTDQYRGIMKEVDGLEVYNTLLQRQLDNQQREMDQISASIDQVTVIERQILPLMLRMVDGLAQFVELDVPFLEEERANRVNFLRDLMERSDVSVAEKFRRVLESFQVENDYGRTIEAYKGSLEVAGGSREVDFLRIGRVALLYQSVDTEYTGRWDIASREWKELSGPIRNQIRQGLKMARKQVAPDLIMLPLPGPEDAQ